MKKCHLVCCLIVFYLNIIKSERNLIDASERRNEVEIDEKVYFPGKTNDDEVNLKRLANSLATSLLRETSSNRLDDDTESEEQLHGASSNHINVMIVKADEERKSFSRQSDSNVNNHNKPSSLLNKFIGHFQDSREEDENIDEHDNKLFHSNSKKSSPATQRIPPPSLITSASGKSSLRVCEISKFH